MKFLKSRLLGLAAIEKACARQRSRLTWLCQGDANTRYFQIMANVRKKRNFIHMLQANGTTVTTQSEKHKIIFDHFSRHIGTYHPRECSINLAALGWDRYDLQHIEEPFIEQEVKRVIFDAPKEKAPDLDGYIGLFFSSCWDTIRSDLMQAINHFYNMNKQELHLLNQAFVVLIPKKADSFAVSDYRPISLVHSFAKIMSKLLANRLAPEL